MTKPVVSARMSRIDVELVKKKSESKRSCPEKMWAEIFNTELGQPFMRDGLDYSLLTLGEWKLIYELEAKHNRIIEERSRELRFRPEYGLSEKERDATMRCMTYEELQPIFKGGAIFEKCKRMMDDLTLKEKVDVRIYRIITVHFSEFGPIFKSLSDEKIFVWTEGYYRIMKKHDLLTFEEPYSFLSDEHKRRVLEVGSKLSPDEYLFEYELSEM